MRCLKLYDNILSQYYINKLINYEKQEECLIDSQPTQWPQGKDLN